MAAVGAASAQSTVTISGTIDTGFEKASSAAKLQMAHSRSGTSGFNIAGSEDLGGGLKANFFIGTSFDTSFQAAGGAAPGTTIGNNNMFVELAGGFGSVKLGRSVDPAFLLVQSANSTKGVTGYTTRAGVLDNNGVYISNQFLYTTPNISGFQAQVSFAPSEVAGASAHSAVGLSYAAGPLVLTLASSKLANVTAGVPTADLVTGVVATPAAAAAAATARLTQVGAAYDFGVARVLFTYTDRSKAASTVDNSWALGVTAPVGPGLLWADYAVRELAGDDNRGFQVGYKYQLSKRTQAYANFGSRKVGAAARTSGYGFGLAHNF